jgi:thiol-disulfide isomerase/thioredoxin
MLRLTVRFCVAFAGVTALLAAVLAYSEQAGQLAAASSSAPTDPRAAKLFAKATKEYADGKLAPALEDFRKADQQAGNHCLACEWKALTLAQQMQEYTTAHEEAALLMEHVGTPEEKAQVHLLTGDLCMAEGGYRIFEKPFQDANKEYETSLALNPGQPACLYRDGLALAHLHQYDKAKERFDAYLKTASPQDLEYARAKLFVAQPELARKRTAPDFQIVSLDGKTIHMRDLQGKVVLIDFWATWCGPCKQALPHLKEIVEKFQGKPLVVLSVSLDNDEATWKNFVAHNGMTWTQYRDGGFDGPIATRFGIKAIPTTFSIDVNGFVQDRQVGDGKIEEELTHLLEEATPDNKAVAQR